ncbi:MAG TPA: hypothetical protein VFZ65_09625 [Planctomycetota bacterium]|nr:hypothetical protein [Planctomycetota bacterium]
MPENPLQNCSREAPGPRGRRCWLGLAAVLIAAVPAPAQLPRRTPVPDARLTPPTAPQTSVDTHSETTSRDLFSACDADGDDRLDLFEVSDAFDSIMGPQDSAGFLRLDLDRDGFVSWPEFDAHFLAIVKRGGSFRVRTCRRLVQQAPERQPAQTATPLEQFLHMFDANGNGGLDPAECDRIVEQSGLPPELGSRLRMLDLDQSGRVEATELAPWFEQLRGLLPTAGAARPDAAHELAPPWSAADRDHDGAIDATELDRVLRSLDPGLSRWTRQLLRRLDLDHSGSLSPAELTGSQPAAERRTSAAPPNPPLPQQAPVR